MTPTLLEKCGFEKEFSDCYQRFDYYIIPRVICLSPKKEGFCWQVEDEIADKIAKWRRKGVCRLDMDHLVFNTGDLQEVEGYKSELMKEVGDCAWFIAGIADCFGFTLEEVMQQNLDKLASRRERGVIDSNGDNR